MEKKENEVLKNEVLKDENHLKDVEINFQQIII
jgi:hypothetical protein